MTAILEQLQGLVAAAEIPAGTLGVALILGLFGLMVVGLVLGQELAFVLGGAGVIVGWLAWGTPGVTIAMTKIYDQMQSYSMVAIPMFVLMANFLTHSKVADGLFESIRYLLGPLKGGLGLAVILVSTVFAATTGIVGASVVTMGMLSLPVLLRSGYKPSLACGMVCAGGSLGILIPPSIMLVSMGSYAEVSVGKIFFAAIVPGLSLSLGYIIYLMVVCHIHPDWGPAMSPEELAEMPLKKRITGSLINLIPPLILIFGVLGSIFGGIATPTEAAGIGALFSLILAIFYKQFSWKMLYESLIDTAKTTAMVFIILFGAAAFTGVFMSLDGDQIIADWVLSMGIGKWGAFAIMMVIMFLLGMFIDWLGIVMIVFPIFLPIMDTFGFDRLWLVAVSATLLQTCFMTPPFGFALFYVKGILPPSIKIQEVYRGVIPFIIIICIVTALCAVFPPLVSWLPSLLACFSPKATRSDGGPSFGPLFSFVHFQRTAGLPETLRPGLKHPAAADQPLHKGRGRVRQEAAGRVILLDLPGVHHQCAGPQFQGFRDVVGHKQDGDAALPVDAQELILQLAPGDLVHRAERLVHQQKLRTGGQRPGDAHPLALSAGEGAGIPPRQRRVQPHLLQQGSDFFSALLPLPFLHAGDGGHIGNVLLHGHVGKQAHVLDGVADAAAQGHRVDSGHILPLDQDSARVRRQQAVYQLQHGGLSAAGPADDRHKCARLHIQREVPQNGLGAEGLGDAFKANDRLGHITPPAGPSGAGSPWPHPARPGPPPPPGS